MRLLPILLLGSAAFGQPAPKSHAIFDFHSSFWINLHQFLSIQADSKTPEAVDSPEWQSALEIYRSEIVPKDSLGTTLATLNYALSLAGDSEKLPDSIDPKVAAALTKAAPIYRRQWWTKHHESNLAWIAALQPRLAKYGDAMQRDISAAWQTPWLTAAIRVDVCAFAGINGAYTTDEPAPHITINSTEESYRGDAALEMMFHESSHLFDEKVNSAIERERVARNVLMKRRRFGHAVLFYTAGEIARRHLDGYTQFAIRYGVFENGWPGALPVLEKDWKPYLDGKTSLEEAIKAMMDDYSIKQ